MMGLIRTINGMDLWQKLSFMAVLLIGTFIGMTLVTTLPFVILVWPLFLIVAAIQLAGQAAIWGVWKLITYPFRKPAADKPTAPAKPTPEQDAIGYAGLIGFLIGGAWAGFKLWPDIKYWFV